MEKVSEDELLPTLSNDYLKELSEKGEIGWATSMAVIVQSMASELLQLREHNASLLEAAKAAKDLIDQEYGPDHLPDEYYQLRAAIAQAEGSDHE